MIRSLRRKFLFIAMLSLLGTLAILCTAVGFGIRHIVIQRADRPSAFSMKTVENFPHQRPPTRPWAWTSR